jgi:IrrE N-terminal-like domain
MKQGEPMAVVDIDDPGRVLWELRRLAPNHSLAPSEDLELAETQARRLLELLRITRPPVSLAEITALLGIRVTIDHSTQVVVPAEPVWEAGGWHIVVALMDSRRTRAVVAHQLKHLIDDQYGGFLYPAIGRLTTADRRDRAAAHFSSSLLMPRDWLEEAWRHNSHTVTALAKRFGSPEAMVRARLVALGLAWPDELNEVNAPPPLTR